MAARRLLPGLLASVALSVLACRRENAVAPSAPATGRDPVAAEAPDTTPTTTPAVATRPWRDALRDDRLSIKIPDFTPAIGAAQPLVTIVHFGDYAHAGSVAQAKVIRDALARWPDDVRVAFVHVPAPRSALGRQLAQLAAAAGAQHKFWEAHERLFAETPATAEAAAKSLVALGVDGDALHAALTGGVHKPWLASTIASARALGVAGPGVVMVNGRSPESADELAALIAEERDRMAGFVADGLPRADVYPEILAAASIPVAIANPSSGLDPSVNYAIPVAGRPTIGPADAPVTITVFSDFQCPFCARAHQLCTTLRERHPEDVRCAFHQMPLAFHPNARELARAALAADRSGKFWAMHDAIFAGDMSAPGSWKKAARKAKLDPKKLARLMTSPEIEQRIVADETIARSFGVSGTPTFFVNGRIVSGAQDISVFEALVAEELPKAKAFAASDRGGAGTLYDRMIEGFVSVDVGL